MAIEVQILLILIAVAATTYRTAKELVEQRKIAVEKGIDPARFSLFVWAVSLNLLPIVAYAIFRLQAFHSLWFPVLVLLSYAPGLLLAGSIGDALERGYDFQRRAAKKVKEYEFAGYLLLIYWLGIWGVFFFFIVQVPA